MPQWSLARKARKTVRVDGEGVVELQAAMEPGPEGQEDDPTPTQRRNHHGDAAMEPGPEGQEDAARVNIPNRDLLAAMEPGPEGQEDNPAATSGRPR